MQLVEEVGEWAQEYKPLSEGNLQFQTTLELRAKFVSLLVFSIYTATET